MIDGGGSGSDPGGGGGAVAPRGGGPLLVGLVGCGAWGSLVLRDLRALGARVAVADPSPDARAAALAAGAGEAVASAEALGDADGWVVATPASTHAAVVGRLLERGGPVFCEKPLAVDAREAGALAESGRGRLFVMHVWRYHAGVAALAAIARGGELGPVEFLRTTRTGWTSPRTDVDPVWTLVPHDLTVALAVLGEIPRARFAVAERRDGAPVGMVAVLGDGPVVVVEVSTRHGVKRREVRLHARGGVAVLPAADSPCVEILRHRGAPPAGLPEVERRAVSTEPALLRELRVFVEHLRGGPPPPTDAAEGALVVARTAELRALAGLP